MNQQNLKLEKVRKSCKAAKNVTNAFAIISIVGVVLCIVGAMCLLFFRGEINPVIAERRDNLTLNGISINGILSFRFDPSGLIDDGLYAEACAIACAFSAIVCGFVAFLFRAMHKVFLFLEESESPFCDPVLKICKTAFILFIIVTALVEGPGMALMLGLCLWCIYCILDYGVALQMEVDEIL